MECGGSQRESDWSTLSHEEFFKTMNIWQKFFWQELKIFDFVYMWFAINIFEKFISTFVKHLALKLFQVEKSSAFKCGTFGAANIQTRCLATGDFKGHLAIWLVILFLWIDLNENHDNERRRERETFPLTY